VNLTSASDIGRVYLSCSTNAPNASCAIASSDTLDIYTVDFSKSLTPTATVTVTTAPNAAQAGFFGGSQATASLALVVLAIILVSLFIQGTGLRLGPGLSGLLLGILLVPSCGGGSSGGGGGTTPGNYAITVSAYTVSNTGGAADATTTIQLTVN
jgi:hypothetical protein